MAYLVKRPLHTMTGSKSWLRLILMMSLLHPLNAAVDTGEKKEEVMTHSVFPLTPPSILARTTLRCMKGEFMGEMPSGVNACFPCPDNTYQDEDIHSLPECKPCKTFEKHIPFEVTTKNCTATSNAELVCAEGYYYYKRDRDDDCKKCKICAFEQNKYTGRNCTNTTDTVCCEHPDKVVVKVESEVLKDFVCVNQTTISTTTSAPTTTSPTKEVSNCHGAVFPSNRCLPGESPVHGCETQSSGVLCKPNPGHNESNASTLSTDAWMGIAVTLVGISTVVILLLLYIWIKSACMKIRNRKPHQYKFSQPSSATEGSVGPDSDPDKSSDLLEYSEDPFPV